MNNKQSLQTISRQRGTIALLISLIILTLITFVSLYTAKTVSVEQKISGNEYRSRVAFEAAEAGMEAAMTYISRSYGGPDRDSPLNGLEDELIFETNGDVVVGIPSGDETDTKIFDNNSRVIVKLAGTKLSVDITALGISGDGSAQRTIRKRAAVVDPLPGFPNVPFSARGAVTVQGSASVWNPEGNSTIRTGGVYGWTSSGANTNIANPGHDNYPECLGGSNSCDDPIYSGKEGCNSTPDTNYVKCGTIQASNVDTINIDIDQNFLGFKNATDEEFFRNMFGLSKARFQAKRVDRYVAPADFCNEYTHPTNPGVDKAHGEVIWVTGSVPATCGIDAGCYYTSGSGPNSKDDAFDENCEDADGVLDPIILIVDGDMAFTQSPMFFGMVYITGDITSNGNTEIQGALAQEKKPASVDVTGSLDIWYDSAILEQTSGNGPYSTATGTWKDF